MSIFSQIVYLQHILKFAATESIPRAVVLSHVARAWREAIDQHCVEMWTILAAQLSKFNVSTRDLGYGRRTTEVYCTNPSQRLYLGTLLGPSDCAATVSRGMWILLALIRQGGLQAKEQWLRTLPAFYLQNTAAASTTTATTTTSTNTYLPLGPAEVVPGYQQTHKSCRHPVHAAITAGNVPLLKILLDRVGFNIHDGELDGDPSGLTCPTLMAAAAHGRVNCIKPLLERGAVVDLSPAVKQHHQPLIIYVASIGQADFLDALLSSCKPRIRDVFGTHGPVLHVAIQRSHPKIVETVLNSAHVDDADKEWLLRTTSFVLGMNSWSVTPLQHAAMMKQTASIHAILRHCWTTEILNTPTSHYVSCGGTDDKATHMNVIHVCAKNNLHGPLEQILWSRQCTVEMVRQPLHEYQDIAADQKHKVEEALSAATPEFFRHYTVLFLRTKHTPLSIACQKGHTLVVRALCNYFVLHKCSADAVLALPAVVCIVRGKEAPRACSTLEELVASEVKKPLARDSILAVLKETREKLSSPAAAAAVAAAP